MEKPIMNLLDIAAMISFLSFVIMGIEKLWAIAP